MGIRIPQFLQTDIIVFTEDTFAIGLAGCWAAVHNGFPEVGIIAVFYDGGAGEFLSPFKLDAFVGVFNCLIVGVGVNVEKTPLFTPDERVALVKQATSNLPNIEVLTFTGLAVAFVRQCNARVMIRGVRPLTDIAGEFTMMMANRQLDEDIETVFLMADEEFAHVSSSLIKQITPLSTDEMLAKFVPASITPSLRQKLGGPPA